MQKIAGSTDFLNLREQTNLSRVLCSGSNVQFTLLMSCMTIYLGTDAVCASSAQKDLRGLVPNLVCGITSSQALVTRTHTKVFVS